MNEPINIIAQSVSKWELLKTILLLAPNLYAKLVLLSFKLDQTMHVMWWVWKILDTYLKCRKSLTFWRTFCSEFWKKTSKVSDFFKSSLLWKLPRKILRRYCFKTKWILLKIIWAINSAFRKFSFQINKWIFWKISHPPKQFLRKCSL